VYGRPFGGTQVRIIAFLADKICESGLMVAIRSDRLNKNANLDSNWLTFVSRPEPPANGEWDDDIPFSRAVCYSHQNGKRLMLDKFKEGIYLET
jgi:hypothetical protein